MKFPTLTVEEAKRLNICRVCRGKAMPRVIEIAKSNNVYMVTDAFFMGFDNKTKSIDEFAHMSCLSRLDKEAKVED